MSDIYISFSDIDSFLRCRQQWDFKSANRQSIRHKTTPKLYLTLGTAVHKALEANARGQDPVAALEAYLTLEREVKIDAYVEEYGFQPWGSELKEFDETSELAMGLVHQYFEHYGRDNPLGDQGLEYVGIEVPFKIDITEHLGFNLSKPGTRVFFVGTLDALAVNEFDDLFIVENKTYSTKPDSEMIQWHFQSMGYAVALRWLTGLDVAGGLYNGIAKKLISEPKVLKSGLLSVDKRQSTTYSRMAQAIRENGEDESDSRFSEILSHLRSIDEQGDTRFFYREKFFFTDEQLAAWETDFLHIVVEMLDNPRIYRTIPFKGCGDCWFSDLCHTKHSGGDVDYLMEKRYTQDSTSYGTLESVKGVEPTVVTSVAELRRYLDVESSRNS
jgi:hypothetical protein